MIFFYIKNQRKFNIFIYNQREDQKRNKTGNPMTDFLMKPKIDFAFKEIMEVEKARTGFLAAVLHLKPDDIRETRILNSHLRKAHFVLFELPKLPKELRKECSGIEL